MRTSFSILLLLLSTNWLVAQPPQDNVAYPQRVLEISRPEGRVLVELFGIEVDGPVQLPVRESQVSAIQLLTQIEGDKVRVLLAAVDTDLGATPIGSYLLAFEEEAVRVPELRDFGVGEWSLRYTRRSLTEKGECCSCGRLSCCPDGGKCIGCGICGDCCLDGGPPAV